MINPITTAAALAIIIAAPGIALAEARPQAGSRDSRVTYANYVSGQVYHVQTRVRNVTLIELGDGERIQSIAIGDSESFQIDKLEGSNVFTVKPVIEGASTNMTVETDRRFYFMQVVETARGTPSWSVKFTVPGQGRSQRRASSAAAEAAATLPRMRYAVSTKSTGANFAPIGVSDDGTKTYFKIPAGAPMPSVFRADAKGLEYTVNTTTDGTVITAAGRSDRWVLRYGDSYVCITGEPAQVVR
ncbi:TrbG/VirB9 family P-type conjugative transfer protein [Paracoccus pantotrophus]|uniref:TrbG/VirB9 family P-type conjugative transfer protein n=1 Tax=Paracoccus pantotrophus TaxID=82367 RepID=A0A7H9C241_PARPN|nr:TrbG/VirB9 family P-type conjugative transfer protein [Paracoccus pantotrophus]MDF3855628.1 TrbG/VirB9 family P-type conjugative transfer protein [Paracoccus pantotrophus]QLH17058.1 TrbG/VirB9 family P-type conjugative transfer protein [Paracoccus pantotrophus]SFP05108.1 type IV secretion system protein VirB9 [Paracoccus pantotrophus]